jgi:acyl-CoA thioester hydrolase
MRNIKHIKNSAFFSNPFCRGREEEITAKHTFQVRFGDTDAFGCHPNYYQWMDQATHEFFRSIGCSSVNMFEEKRIGIPLLETYCQFFLHANFGDTIEVISEIEKVYNKVFKINHTFYRNGTKLAEGSELRVWTDFSHEEPRALPIPDDIRELLLSHSIK